jgi:hypothetical protein
VNDITPRDRGEFESFVDELLVVTPQPTNNIVDFAVGYVEAGLNLAQDTLNLLHLQNAPERNKVVSVQNFENFKRDLKRIIMQMHQNSYPTHAVPSAPRQ